MLHITVIKMTEIPWLFQKYNLVSIIYYISWFVVPLYSFILHTLLVNKMTTKYTLGAESG